MKTIIIIWCYDLNGLVLVKLAFGKRGKSLIKEREKTKEGIN